MACVRGGRAAAQAGGGVVKVARDHFLQYCEHTRRARPTSSSAWLERDDEAAVLVQWFGLSDSSRRHCAQRPGCLVCHCNWPVCISAHFTWHAFGVTGVWLCSEIHRLACHMDTDFYCRPAGLHMRCPTGSARLLLASMYTVVVSLDTRPALLV